MHDACEPLSRGKATQPWVEFNEFVFSDGYPKLQYHAWYEQATRFFPKRHLREDRKAQVEETKKI